jgi:hypothetical protein
MAEIDYSALMTPDGIVRTRKASELIGAYVSGEKLKAKLHDALEIGDVLLAGSHEAMKAARTNQPLGKPYNMASPDGKGSLVSRSRVRGRRFRRTSLPTASFAPDIATWPTTSSAPLTPISGSTSGSAAWPKG